MTRIIGLTGGIGSGKSTVSRMLVELGATLVDADAIVHELQAPHTPMLDAIAQAFGSSILKQDGSLDREALGALVFRDEPSRTRLGAIVHPPTLGEMMRRTRVAIDAGVPLVVLDVPLLFEGGRSGKGSAAFTQYDATVLVWVPREIQIQRTVARDACEPAEAERRIDAQIPIDEKKAMATHVIDNSGDQASTLEQVRDLYGRLLVCES